MLLVLYTFLNGLAATDHVERKKEGKLRLEAELW
jgi:hypothetical protein